MISHKPIIGKWEIKNRERWEECLFEGQHNDKGATSDYNSLRIHRFFKSLNGKETISTNSSTAGFLAESIMAKVDK